MYVFCGGLTGGRALASTSTARSLRSPGTPFFGPLFLQSGFSDTVFHDLREFCRDFVVNLLWISLWIFCPLFEETDGPKKSTPKIHTKIHDKIHALRMKIHHDECSAEGLS